MSSFNPTPFTDAQTATTFTTYFGDYLHGLWITWENTPTGSGSSDLIIKFRANYRSFLQVFGDDSAAAAPFANTSDATLKTTLEGAVPATPTNKFYNHAIKAGAQNAVYYAGASNADTAALYDFYVEWDNPNTSGTPASDGVWGIAIYKYTAGDTTSETTLATTPSAVSVNWIPRGTGNFASAANYAFDIAPGSQY